MVEERLGGYIHCLQQFNDAVAPYKGETVYVKARRVEVKADTRDAFLAVV